MQEEETKFRFILISSILICIIGVIFLMISMQSFWYTSQVEKLISTKYKGFADVVEEDFINSYIKDASYIASQKQTQDILLQKKSQQTELSPFEYFLLHTPAFLYGDIIDKQNTVVHSIAQDKSDTSKLSITKDTKLAQSVIEKGEVQAVSNEGILNIGVPVYSAEKQILGAVILSFSLPLTTTDYTSLLIDKQKVELERNLFNRKEFIYTVTILGIIFLIISFGLFNSYTHIHKGYSFLDSIIKKKKKEESDINR